MTPPQTPLAQVTLILEFTGILNDKMAGFYRSSYTTAQGATKYMAVTQFEARLGRFHTNQPAS